MHAADSATLVATRSPHPPGPSYRTPLPFMWEARPNPLAYALRQVRSYGEVVCIRSWLLPPIFLFTRPEHVRYVLQENNRNYRKGDIVGKMKVVLGEGLFTSDGEFWRRQRRLAQPAFHRQRIQGFAELMTDAADKSLDTWRGRALAGEPIDVMAEMSALTLAVVGRALFGVDLSDRATAVGRNMLVALEELTRRALNPFALPLALPLPSHRRLQRATRELDRVVFEIIEQRRASDGNQADLLAMLMEARDADTGEGMTTQQLRDEVMTFVLAGHETTAVTLAWTFHLLSRNRDVEARVRAEVAEILAGRTPALEDLPRLLLLRRVIEESLRLYPPVGAIERMALAADEIDGYAIPPGASLFLSPYVTHRDPQTWPDPERFDPDRFLPEHAASRHRFAYFPFGAGPRLCIGNEFALMEAQLILAMVLQRFRLEPVPGRAVEEEVRVTLRPKYGVWMIASEASSQV